MYEKVITLKLNHLSQINCNVVTHYSVCVADSFLHAVQGAGGGQWNMIKSLQFIISMISSGDFDRYMKSAKAVKKAVRRNVIHTSQSCNVQDLM
jgi:hypothetical protein